MIDSPILLNSFDDEGHQMTRIEVKSNEQKSEDWLQNLIHNHPSILPVSKFDETYSPLIPVARELETKSGRIDNLYLSPTGKITIVETKLWKNPEKHRIVVAQIIDYAKEVSTWNYDQLNMAIMKACQGKDSDCPTLDSMVEPYLGSAGLSITDFQERVISCLQGGEFLLLIVGDKISSNLALLTDAIQGSPGMDFRMGLVELHLYPLQDDSDWPVVIVPDIVGRTVEKTRGVIKIQYVGEKPDVSVEINEEDSYTSKGKITAEIFLQKCPDSLSPLYEQFIKKCETKHLHIYWGTTGFSMRPNIAGKLTTIFEAYPEWALSLIRKQDAEKIGITDEYYREYMESLSLAQGAVNVLASGKKYIKNEELTKDTLEVVLETTILLAEKLQNNN